MSLIINHNMMAMTAARNLANVYDALSTSTQRLSSGLRINSAADDAAGLAVRETMRADIAVLNQGVRNAGDAISLIQTAEGALSVIDEKLIRMKELAEQAATGSYTTAQREIMDSEYQAMADEIDRIANATDFNGIKLLDGSVSAQSSSGIKIHFGTANDSAEDYYYINVGDMRATESSGLQVGGGATAEILTASTGFATKDSTSIGTGYFGYYYDQSADQSGTNTEIGDLAGFYQVTSGANTLSDLVQQINQGTAARAFATISDPAGDIADEDSIIQIGDQKVIYLDVSTQDSLTSDGTYTGNSYIILTSDGLAGTTQVSADAAAADIQSAVMAAVNAYADNVWAISGTSGTEVMFVAENPGAAGNNIAISTAGGNYIASIAGDYFSGGGETWATASAVQGTNNQYFLRLTGNDKGDNYDINIANPNTLLSLSNLGTWTESTTDFSETQDASGSGSWDGADILTQSAAQAALTQIDSAISSKDQARANLGALQNRLENTITNLTVQAENLQAAESRISDVDVATEMTEFTKNNILVQAATSMLAQANTLPQLALTLMGG